MYRLLLLVFPFLALGKPNNSCVLVFQGAVNRMMLPVDVSVSNMPVWRSVDQKAGWENEYFFYNNITKAWNLQADHNTLHWGDAFGNVDSMKIVDGCPSATYPFVHWDSQLKKHKATNVTVAVDPLNTLCWPQPGVVKGYTKVEVLPNANSLSECALQVAKRKDYFYGVQWTIADSRCVAFSSEPLDTVGKVKVPTRSLSIYFDKPKQRIYEDKQLGPSLACLLQCNKLPVKGSGKSSIVKTDTLEKCVAEGERHQKSSVSFQDKMNCIMYDKPYYEAGDKLSQYCDVLPSYKVPGATPTTTTTTSTTTSTKSPGGRPSDKKKIWVAVGSAGGALGALLILAGGIVFYKKSHGASEDENFEAEWGPDYMEQQPNWNGNVREY